MRIETSKQRSNEDGHLRSLEITDRLDENSAMAVHICELKRTQAGRVGPEPLSPVTTPPSLPFVCFYN